MMDLNAYKKAIAALYNQRSETYDQGKFHPHLAQLLIDYVDIKPQQRVLDLATGTGLVAIEAAKKVGSDGFVLGVDVADLMLTKAQEKAQKLRLSNLKFLKADVETLELSAESFDVIVCCAAMPLFNDIGQVLSNCYQQLKKEGKLGFNCWTEDSFIEGVILNKIAPKYSITFPHWHQKTGTSDEIHKQLTKIGFVAIEIKTNQLGEYVDLESIKNKWEMMINFPISKENLFPFQQLSQEALSQAQIDYYEELEALETSQGVWNNITTLTVIAHKK